MLNEQFEALADPRRRRLLVALLEQNPQEDVQIPEDVHEDDTPVAVLEAEMYHTHLPKLEEAGFIRWEPDTHQVMKGPRFDEIRPLLELMYAHSDELPEDWP